MTPTGVHDAGTGSTGAPIASSRRTSPGSAANRAPARAIAVLSTAAGEAGAVSVAAPDDASIVGWAAVPGRAGRRRRFRHGGVDMRGCLAAVAGGRPAACTFTR